MRRMRRKRRMMMMMRKRMRIMMRTRRRTRMRMEAKKFYELVLPVQKSVSEANSAMGSAASTPVGQ